MATVSLRLPNGLLKATEHYAETLHLPRAEYIRRAIVAMNEDVLKQSRREQLMKVSKRVVADSMKVNAEFAAIEDSSPA